MKSKFYPRRTFIADQIDIECPNKTSLYFQLPFQKVNKKKIINSSIHLIEFLGLFSRLEYSKTNMGLFIWQSKSNFYLIQNHNQII
jgi:hypothetical protein